jgi:hypothetical protein
MANLAMHSDGHSAALHVRLKLGDTHPHTLESWHNLIDLYEARGKPGKANEWRAKLQQTEAVEE